MSQRPSPMSAAFSTVWNLAARRLARPPHTLRHEDLIADPGGSVAGIHSMTGYGVSEPCDNPLTRSRAWLIPGKVPMSDANMLEPTLIAQSILGASELFAVVLLDVPAATSDPRMARAAAG